MIKYFRQRLFWKFFFSYLALALLTMIVMGVVIRILLPGLFDSHINRMMIIFSQRGIADDGFMMGDMPMMDDLSLVQDLFVIFNQIVLDAFLYAFLPASFVALVVSILMSRKFVQPLQEMEVVTDRIAEGQFDQRLPIKESSTEYQDELEHLCIRINKMASRLEQVEDMRKKLIGDIAHELRTPLTVIKGAMEGFVDGVLTPDSATFERIYRQADRLERLVDDLQELNYLEMGTLELDYKVINIEKFMGDIKQTMRIKFNTKGVDFTLDLPNEKLVVKADEDRLEQIMLNLLDNALRYTPTGGEVQIIVKKEGQRAKISVKDSGVGITEEHLTHVFDRFYRLDEARARQDGGSGIGLTIVKKLVEAHKGQIWVESGGSGEGACFSFTLPVYDYS
ncbi:MAG: HAMP domain-containing sensor histidine kinase [Brevefilum sp.]|nr:HAMP domain-containing sensor histidine kinase [Brevefilum sp.]